MEVDGAIEADGEIIYPYRESVTEILKEHGLTYKKGGRLVAVTYTSLHRRFEEIIRSRDVSSLQVEFDRIESNLENDPAAAVAASCALLESLFKTYIADEKLEMPSKQTIKPLWAVVRKHLKLEPDEKQDEDIRTVLVGLGSIVDGIGSLRTHKSSAHGHGKKIYKLKARHARIASHAAFTLASFILETWKER